MMETDIITQIVTSQAPWMVMCIVLIGYIIKTQNEQLKSLVVAVSNVALALTTHDSQAKNIQEDVLYIREHCEDCTPKK
jgi:hypothetical protein